MNIRSIWPILDSTENYYESLYDADFLMGREYLATSGTAKVYVAKETGPRWSSWQAPDLSAVRAEQLWDKAVSANLWEPAMASGPGADFVCLLACEEAYRAWREPLFRSCLRSLFATPDPALRLKGLKLARARSALQCIVNARNTHLGRAEDTPLSIIKNHALTYVRDKKLPPPSGEWTAQDILVEAPVARCWNDLAIEIADERAVTSFYEMTPSYILELTAANHQIETLSGYSLVLDALEKLGIKKIFDVGAGIGTFLLLASRRNIAGTYADLTSNTAKYAEHRLKEFNAEVECLSLDPDGSVPFSKADCVVCTEVLEHVFGPETLVENIHAALNPGGLFVVSESFDYTDEFCTHLPQHKGKGNKRFERYMANTGFRRIPLEFDIHPHLYVRV